MQNMSIFWIFYLVIVCLAIASRWPKHVELLHSSVVLQTKLRSFSTAYERISSVEIVRNTCCWTGRACTFARGMFTDTSECIFFRSPDCASSIAFTPANLEEMIEMVRRTPLANRIMEVH
eukprot:TRINITY_DN66132_c1_g1_i1.p4 TRINITY_DN66132_c1_g1~~TRINITY_DN66132_c1_g1_i1.p4  ORF type:complete len:120 (+),score=57.66 TRINITY_DN66132_c1_g1_i1:545-904(+)